MRIYLPLADSGTARAAASPQAAASPHGPARRILLVEDDASVGEMVEAMLSDLGHEVLRAEAAAPALTILEAPGRIDLMLTDLIMPGGMNGVELAHAAVALRPGLPVILTSGYTGEALGAATEAPWPLLAKPYLAESLAAIIDGRRASRRSPGLDCRGGRATPPAALPAANRRSPRRRAGAPAARSDASRSPVAAGR